MREREREREEWIWIGGMDARFRILVRKERTMEGTVMADYLLLRTTIPYRAPRYHGVPARAAERELAVPAVESKSLLLAVQFVSTASELFTAV